MFFSSGWVGHTWRNGGGLAAGAQPFPTLLVRNLTPVLRRAPPPKFRAISLCLLFTFKFTHFVSSQTTLSSPQAVPRFLCAGCTLFFYRVLFSNTKSILPLQLCAVVVPDNFSPCTHHRAPVVHLTRGCVRCSVVGDWHAMPNIFRNWMPES